MKHGIREGVKVLVAEKRRSISEVLRTGLLQLDVADGRGSRLIRAIKRKNARKRAMNLTKLV